MPKYLDTDSKARTCTFQRRRDATSTSVMWRRSDHIDEMICCHLPPLSVVARRRRRCSGYMLALPRAFEVGVCVRQLSTGGIILLKRSTHGMAISQARNIHKRKCGARLCEWLLYGVNGCRVGSVLAWSCFCVEICEVCVSRRGFQ